MQRKINKITTVNIGLSTELLGNARKMRRNPTRAEKVLWKLLRDRKLNDWKFRRQHPVADYILDFYCVETNVGIEVDGEVHQSTDQQEYDENRTKTLSEYGVHVIRFTNHEVITNVIVVLDRIVDFTNSQNRSLTPPWG